MQNTPLWQYQNEPYLTHQKSNGVAFLYVITNLENNMRYVGKKQLYSTRSLPPLKGFKRRRIIVKESDWLTYWSSSESLKSDIRRLGHHQFKREILMFFMNKQECNFAELVYSIKHNVLEDGWYNKNIERRYYPASTEYSRACRKAVRQL